MWPFKDKNTEKVIQLQLVVNDQTAKIEEQSNKLTKQSLEIETKISELGDVQEKALTSHLQEAIKNFSTQIFPSYISYKDQKAYQTSPSFYSVVSAIVNAAAGLPVYPEFKDKSSVPDTDKIWNIVTMLPLEKRIEIYTYILTYGEIFLYKEKVEFGVNAGIIDMRPMHPQNIEVVVTETFPLSVVGFLYWDSLHGERIEILKEDMIFIKYFNPDPDPLLRIRGLAPVKVLSKIIQLESSGIDVSVAQMQNGGVPGILSMSTLNLTNEVIGQHRDNYQRYLGNKNAKGAPYFAGGEMEYIAIGTPLVEMDVINALAANIDQVCNVFHVSSTSFNNKSASTESNVVTHDKSFYTKGVLPPVKLVIDGINMQAVVDIKTKAKLKEDISDITELQPNMKEIAEGLAAMPFVVPNDMFEKLGWPRRIEPLMDEVWSKSGYTLAEESSMVVPTIDNTAGDYNNAVTQAAKLLKIA